MSFENDLLFIFNEDKMDFNFEEELFFPDKSEKRYLNDIRKSLSNEKAVGPEILYVISMDIGKHKDREDLINRHLLYGIVAYNKGLIGNEPVRSQGHIHAISKYSNDSTPEVYQVLQGEAYIYMQNLHKNELEPSFAVKAEVGDIVIVPPGWAHFALNANPENIMVFGAWCIRDYAFEYENIRNKNGLSYYPIFNDNSIQWLQNKNYPKNKLIIKESRQYKEFGLTKESIYRQYEKNHDKFNFVTEPKKYSELWENFIP